VHWAWNQGSPQRNAVSPSKAPRKNEDLFGENAIFWKNAYFLGIFRPFLCRKLCIHLSDVARPLNYKTQDYLFFQDWSGQDQNRFFKDHLISNSRPLV